MKINIVPLLFLIGGAIMYVREITSPLPRAPFADIRLDVICIAALGMLAHLAFRQSNSEG